MSFLRSSSVAFDAFVAFVATLSASFRCEQNKCSITASQPACHEEQADETTAVSRRVGAGQGGDTEGIGASLSNGAKLVVDRHDQLDQPEERLV